MDDVVITENANYENILIWIYNHMCLFSENLKTLPNCKVHHVVNIIDVCMQNIFRSQILETDCSVGSIVDHCRKIDLLLKKGLFSSTADAHRVKIDFENGQWWDLIAHYISSSRKDSSNDHPESNPWSWGSEPMAVG